MVLQPATGALYDAADVAVVPHTERQAQVAAQVRARALPVPVLATVSYKLDVRPAHCQTTWRVPRKPVRIQNKQDRHVLIST